MMGRGSDNGILHLHQYYVYNHRTHPNQLEPLRFQKTVHIFHSHQTSTQEAANVVQMYQ